MVRKASSVPPHYLRRNDSKRFPHRMIIYDTETLPKPHREKETQHELNVGQAVYIREDRGEEWIRFDELAQFWDFVEQRSQGKTSLYIFSHNEDYDFPVVKGWRELMNRGWALEQFVIDKGIFFIKYYKIDGRNRRRGIWICDSLNLLPKSLKKIGEAVGLEKDERGYYTNDREIIAEMCKNHVRILVKALQGLFALLSEKDLAGFHKTLASLSKSIFTHRYFTPKILIHKNNRVTKLERKAYHGGRTECFYIGKFSGENFYKIDINSMYPFVMSVYNYPIYLTGESYKIEKERLKDLLEKYNVIADCNITIDKPVIGIKRKIDENGVWTKEREEERGINENAKKLIFPIGTFSATLTTEELKWCLKNGKINKVNHVVWYKGLPIFEQFVKELYDLRLKFEREGNTLYATIIKLIMNSLYGKFGQKVREMSEIGSSIFSDCAERRVKYETGERETIYHLGGKEFKKEEIEQEAEDSLPCICAEVTANARLYLWSIIEQAGLENVYYCDTDSLILNEEGLNRVKSYLHETDLGMFKIEKEDIEIEIVTGKHYSIADDNQHKGIKDDAEKIGENRYKQEQFFHFKSLLWRPDIETTGTYEREKEVKRKYDKAIVDDKGICYPYVLNEK